MDTTSLTLRGFLPERDPLVRFGDASEFAPLDEWGRDLPSLLLEPGFRTYARRLPIPVLPGHALPEPVLRYFSKAWAVFSSAKAV